MPTEVTERPVLNLDMRSTVAMLAGIVYAEHI
jgi:hypothetical protein